MVFPTKNTAHNRAGKREETDKIKDEAPTLRAYMNRRESKVPLTTMHYTNYNKNP
jgi:hypothetical protein